MAKIDLWRISRFPSLSGEGGLRYSGRWHTVGRRIVYMAESPAGAVIEVLVHLELNEGTWPEKYDLMRVAVPAGVTIETIEPRDKGWKSELRVTRALGDAWLRSKRSALARVPSAILPETWNVLLNPEHSDAAEVRIVETIRAKYDARLIAKLR